MKASLVPGTSLVVQWLGLGAFTAKGTSSIPGQGTKIPPDVPKKKKKKDSWRQIPGGCSYEMIPENVEWGTHPPWQT